MSVFSRVHGSPESRGTLAQVAPRSGSMLMFSQAGA
jgi:hypothetical protein